MVKSLGAQASTMEIVHTREMRPCSSPDSSSSVRPSQLHNAMHPRASRGPAAHATPWIHAYPWEPVMRWWSRFPTLRRWDEGMVRYMLVGVLLILPWGWYGSTEPPHGFCQHQQYATARWTNVDENGPVGTESAGRSDVIKRGRLTFGMERTSLFRDKVLAATVIIFFTFRVLSQYERDASKGSGKSGW